MPSAFGKAYLQVRQRYFLLGRDRIWFPHCSLSDIVIGRQSRVGKNFTVLNGVSLGEKNVSEKGMPSVGDNVYIGTGAKLLGNISIGDRVTIGAMTFCDKSVPADSVAYGNPMKIHNKTALK